MADENSITLEERDLAARLVRMGAAAPMNPADLTYDQLERMVNNLPEIYHCTISGQDPQQKLIEISLFDASKTNVQKRAYEMLRQQPFADVPTGRISVEYSPDAWRQLLRSNPENVDLEALRKNLQRWNLPASDSSILSAFEPDYSKNLAEAEKIYRAAQIDLFSRMIRMGLSQPVDMNELDFRHIEQEIAKLPLLAVLEIALEHPDGSIRHVEFIDVVDYSRSSHLTGENQYSFDYEWEGKLRSRYPDASFEEIERARYQEEMEKEVPRYSQERKSGVGSDGIARSFVQDRTPKEHYHLEVQERAYFQKHPEAENQIIHRTTSFRAGLGWLDYFKQGVDNADPMVKTDGTHPFRNLQSGLKNWELKFSPSRLAAGFEPNPAINLREAQLLYYREIIAKTVFAGVRPQLPLEDWRNLSLSQAKEIVLTLPMLLDQADPADWLQTLSVSRNPENIADLKRRFETAGIPFDEKKIRSVLSAPQSKSTERRTKMAAYEISIEDYKKIAYGLAAAGKLNMPREEIGPMAAVDPQYLKDQVRADGRPASVSQKVMVALKHLRGQVNYPLSQISGLINDEVQKIYENTPMQKFTPNPAEPLASDRLRKDVRHMIDMGYAPRLSREDWKNLTEKEGTLIVDVVRQNAPATEKMIESIEALLKSGKFDPEAMDKLLPNGRTAKDLGALTMATAIQAINLGPASEAQIIALKERALVTDEEIARGGITKGTANERFELSRSPDRPAPKEMIEQLEQLRAEGKLKNIPAGITFQAGKDILDQEALNRKIQPAQVVVVRNWMAKKLIPPMEEKNITGMSVAKFRELSAKVREALLKELKPQPAPSQTPEAAARKPEPAMTR